MPVSERTSDPAKRAVVADDGTCQLLQWGGSIVGTGVLAAILLETLFGGFGRTGATTNTGWFALIVTLMCLPFGSLLLFLGIAKWLRNRAMVRSGEGRGDHNQ